MGTRYYEPASGRFISPNPYGHEGSIDLYSYAMGNPVTYCDADGRFASAVYEQAKENPVDAMQYGLDVAGMVPLFGIAPDLVNALVHGVRGNNIDAMLSLAAAIPIVGDVGRGANIVSDGAKMAAKVVESTAKAEAKRGLNLFKWEHTTSMTSGGWEKGDFMLHLPKKSTTKEQWHQNAGRLREQMKRGDPIYDSYRNPVTGEQIKAGQTPEVRQKEKGGFLNAERKLIEDRGWIYDPTTGAYHKK